MREDPGLFKPVRLMGEPTREFTPSMDYRHLLSPAAQANLAEWEANYDQRAKRKAECDASRRNK